ncbi:alpha/beta fold hydrolase [Galactobacter caseinivorans]|uniref:Alpha/beta hydrolase n=1 Tax=Galactobacter caseinivorans TaxID=2676123 RepID=A0A496PKY0_9MICC|nr:alpha/beta hydrolase [Galactobacter caseinivorans]RKW71179.1 alpha/beta hydrolase [Galactobacter caseinivorans]
MSIPFDTALIDDREALTLSVRAGGSTVRTWAYPARNTPRGVILMIHGFRGDHHGLRRLVNALPDYLVIAPDLPGFGATGPFTTAAHDAPGYGAVIDALRTELELPASTVLLGHSFGSIVTSHYAAAHPEAFSRLILVNPICEPALESSQALATRAAQAYYGGAAALPLAAGEALLRARVVVDVTTAAMLTSRDPVTRRYVRDQHRAYFAGFSDPDTLLESYRSSITHTVRDVAGRLTMPSLLIAGETDPLGSVAGQERLAALMPDAALVMIPRVGHLIHYETPQTAADAIEAFLARVP